MRPVIRQSGLRFVAVIAAVMLASCSASPSSSTSPSTAASVAPTTAESTEPTPTTAASTPDTSCDQPRLCTGPMASGAWERSVADRVIHFEVGPGWSAQVGPANEGFQLIREGVDIEGFAANEYHGVVFGDPCEGDTQTDTIGSSPQDLLDFIAARDGISALGPATEVSIGGETALQLDVTVGAPGACPDSTSLNYLWRVGVRGDFHLEIGESARLVALAAGDRAIVFALESFSQAGYDELLQLGDPILASITFD